MTYISCIRKISLVWLVPLLLSCKKDKETDSTANEPEKGYVTGRVTDTKGAPLAGVEILIDNTLIYNSYLSGQADAKGNYKIKVPNGAWMAYAILKKEYNQKRYEIYLDPEIAAGFGGEGATRNFQWKLTGERKAPLTGTYGGNILLTRAVGSELFDSENIEYTLTPVGPLIDGSTGGVLKIQEAPGTYKLPDIPIGRYTVTAVYKSPSGNRPIKLKNRYVNGSAFSPSIQLDFEPDSNDGHNMAFIEYTEK